MDGERFTRTEQIVVLLLTCLIIMGSGFRLWVRPGDLVVEVDPVLWAEEPGQVGQQGEEGQQILQDAADGGKDGSMRAVSEEGEKGTPEELVQEEGGKTVPAEERININTASKETLQLLPGIGPVLAERIIEYRRLYGPFIDVEQLLEVKGIGPKILERLRPLVTVADGTAYGADGIANEAGQAAVVK